MKSASSTAATTACTWRRTRSSTTSCGCSARQPGPVRNSSLKTVRILSFFLELTIFSQHDARAQAHGQRAAGIATSAFVRRWFWQISLAASHEGALNALIRDAAEPSKGKAILRPRVCVFFLRWQNLFPELLVLERAGPGFQC